MLTLDPTQSQVLKWPRADCCLGLFNTLCSWVIWNKGPAGYEQRCDDFTENSFSPRNSNASRSLLEEPSNESDGGGEERQRGEAARRGGEEGPLPCDCFVIRHLEM